ncbi:glycosyltransferase family 2 protein [Caldifermentibacillus hisashii]|jgi:glycosyltransferase involved in cell wall biosynthesis|uniref:glycosyltransferase family 2 protein n=1 Tax=Caldifermentibacillus hisashii TaxID=996558 RepID=UPI0031B7B94A
MNEPMVSIIVPIYNVEEYLEETLKSIVEQTYTNIEIILVNDASTDKSLQIALQFATVNPSIRIINQPFNKGVSAARNTGLDLANGAYIMFVDSDDLLSKNAIKNMMEIVSKQNADLVLGMYKSFNEKGSTLPNIFQNYTDITEGIRVFDYINPELFWNVNSWGKLIKKELIENLYFPEDINYIEDQPFSMYTYLHANNIYLAPSITYFYRTREQYDSLSLIAPKRPISSLNNIFASFKLGMSYFDSVNENKNILQEIYISRVVNGSIKYIFEGALQTKDSLIHKNVLELLINWIRILDPKIVSNESFRKVFVESVNQYLSFLDNTSAKLYIELLKEIKFKIKAYFEQKMPR